MQAQHIMAIVIAVAVCIVFLIMYNQLKQNWSRDERLSFFSSFVALLLAVVTGSLCTLWARSLVAYVALIPVFSAFACSAISFWRSYLKRREKQETEERAIVSKEYDRDDLFEDRDDAMRIAESARKQFDKWVIPAFTFVLSLALIGTSFLLIGTFSQLLPAESIDKLNALMNARKSLEALGFSVCFMLISTLLGVYWNGISREASCRYLRPVGQWLILGGFLYGLLVVLMGIELFTDSNRDFASSRHWDLHVAIFLLYVFIAFGIQMLTNFVIEFYRPRRQGGEERPLYESRLVGIITEPGGIARNIAYTLNYQFGFKVSDTWFYRFGERGLLPFVLVLAACLYLSSCFVLVRTHEMGIRTSFGKYQSAVKPGLRLKMPWPWQEIVTYPVKKIQKVDVGFIPYHGGNHAEHDEEDENAGDPSGRVFLWGKTHHKDEIHYLVAARGDDNEADNDEDVPAINFLSSSISIFYQIKSEEEGLRAYAYHYSDPEEMIKDIAQREIARYFASSDLLEVITTHNGRAQQELMSRIQKSVDSLRLQLGVTIVHLAMTSIHPPVPVAESFQSIVTAQQEKETMEHKAWSYYHQEVEGAKGKKEVLLAQAQAYRMAKSTIPQQEITRFRAQLKNYNQAPKVFKMREYLDVMEDIYTSENIPLYIIATPNAKRITELTFKEKPPSLEDFDTEQK